MLILCAVILTCSHYLCRRPVATIYAEDQILWHFKVFETAWFTEISFFLTAQKVLLLLVTCNCIGKRCLETKYRRKSLDWKVGINQGVNLESMKDDILVFQKVEDQLSDVNYSFASQVRVK